MFWLAEWTRELELLEHAHKQGQPHKDNVVFVQRSPLSLWVHDVSRLQPPSHTNIWLRITDELRAQFSTSTVLCHSENIKTQQRLAERSYWAEAEQKAIRKALHEDETEVQQLYESRYQELLNVPQPKTWIDDTIKTTSTKQAQSEILTLFGLADWEAFKDSIASPKSL